MERAPCAPCSDGEHATVEDQVCTCCGAKTVTILIENSYTDGHQCEQIVQLTAPSDASDLDEYWEDVVYPHTGDGHAVEVYEATGASLGTFYTATITEAADPALVGMTNEWID